MTKIIRFVSLLFPVLALIPMLALSNENIESEGTEDIGLASIWAVGKLSHGGFIKTDAALITYDNESNRTLSINGGWRFTKHLKLGFALGSTVKDVKQLDAKLVNIGPTLGYTDFNKSIGRYSIDLTIGAAYAEDSDGTAFIEPGFYLIKRIPRISPRRLLWSGGISYRKFENTNSSLSGSNNLNSVNLKLGLVFGAY